MKIFILLLVFLPTAGFAQAYYDPQPKIEILQVEVSKDTLFVYRELSTPPHSLAVDQSWMTYRDRLVYVVQRKEIILLRIERPKIRKKKAETEEEYW